MAKMDNIRRAVNVLVKMGATKVILFGSSAEDPETAHDIDLAVSGIPPENILDADVLVEEILQQPFDLVCDSDNKDFFNIISRYGKILYG